MKRKVLKLLPYLAFGFAVGGSAVNRNWPAALAWANAAYWYWMSTHRERVVELALKRLGKFQELAISLACLSTYWRLFIDWLRSTEQAEMLSMVEKQLGGELDRAQILLEDVVKVELVDPAKETER